MGQGLATRVGISLFAPLMVTAVVCGGASLAATMGPPMLDIANLCGAMTHHNVTAMSECVVAESEARSEILQKWDKVSDSSAEKCVKLGRKARRFPYMTMARCLSADTLPAAEIKK